MLEERMTVSACFFGRDVPVAGVRRGGGEDPQRGDPEQLDHGLDPRRDSLPGRGLRVRPLRRHHEAGQPARGCREGDQPPGFLSTGASAVREEV